MKTIAIAVVTALLFSWIPAHATIWYVHPDSTLNSVQAGLDSCTDDDTVLVAPGTYYENIVWPNTYGIDLISECGPDSTILDGNNAGSTVYVDASDSLTLIQGFTIRNGFAEVGGGIYCSGSPRIIGNTITANAGWGGGVFYGWGEDAVFANNIITGNYNDGIMAFVMAHPIIVDNLITDNHESGINIHGSESAIIRGNEIHDNMGNGINCEAGSGLVTIEDNNIMGNGTNGIYGHMPSATHTIRQNIISDNVNNGIGFTEGYAANLVATENTITNNGGAGVSVAFISVFIADNVITGNGTGVFEWFHDDNSSPFRVEHNIISNNAGHGVNTHGGTIVDNVVSYNSEGGIHVALDQSTQGAAYAFIIGNQIEGNTSTNQGGGIYAITTEDADFLHLDITDNTIANNNATEGGGIYVSYDIITPEFPSKISNCEIVGNTADKGAGIMCSDHTPVTINHCTISANNGDGIYCESAAVPAVNYNDIVDNSGYGVRNVDAGVVIDVTHNWWGDPSGPGGVGPGTGDEVSEWVDYGDWFTRPVILDEIVDFEPNTFNKKRNGKWVTTYVELRDPYLPEDIDLPTVLLTGNLPGNVTPCLERTRYGDYDNDGIPDVMFKFDSDAVNAILQPGDSVAVTIRWRASGEWFEKADYIRVINPGGPHARDDVTTPIVWSISPNPFRNTIDIRYEIRDNTKTELKVYDISGRLVKDFSVLSSTVGQKASIRWDGTDDLNRRLPSGVYFLKFEAGRFNATEKLLLIR